MELKVGKLYRVSMHKLPHASWAKKEDGDEIFLCVQKIQYDNHVSYKIICGNNDNSQALICELDPEHLYALEKYKAIKEVVEE